MRLSIRYFAAAREAVGLSEESLEVAPAATVAQLLSLLQARHPGLAAVLPSVRVAVDRALVSDLSSPLPAGAEVALIPPLGGGAPRFGLSATPLALDDVLREVCLGGEGAVVTFTGVVRGTRQGEPVVRLEYEAYEGMALERLGAIVSELEASAPGVRVAIRHRVGTLEPGGVAVVVAAASPHRAQAFDACREAVERLKREVPIWKREVLASGAVWAENKP